MAEQSNDQVQPRMTQRKLGRGCPICGAPPSGGCRPFCSQRCADVDLARWLKESYRVPGEPADRAGESEKPEPD